MTDLRIEVFTQRQVETLDLRIVKFIFGNRKFTK